jgi:hypothetical protein
MKKIQSNPIFKAAGNALADAKITRIDPNMQKCGILVQDGMGTLINDMCDPLFHTHTLVSFEGLTPAEAAEAIEKINAQGKTFDRDTALAVLMYALCDEISRDTVIETFGERRLANLMSEFMGY